jgi:pSer/pThr/pTyr-binding forkhead associated (FHA) protein
MTASTQTNGTGKRPQEIYLILNPRDDKCERRVVLVPQQPQAPVRVGRVINPAKGPAKFDNLLFDTKVLSRNHAEVYCDAQGRVFIRDLGSSNGTYINSFRLSPDAVPSEPFPLLAGQELVPNHPSFSLSSCPFVGLYLDAYGRHWGSTFGRKRIRITLPIIESGLRSNMLVQ